VAIRTTEPAKEGHHSLSVAKRQLRFEYEACVPAGGGLEALVFLVSKLKSRSRASENITNGCSHTPTRTYSSTPQSRALLGLGSAQRRSLGAELADGTGGAEEGHFISAIVIEVDEVALPARSGADGAALAIATDKV
jgi:hypothetical protein